MNRYGHLLSLIRIGPGLVESEPGFRTFSRTEISDDADPMETGQISPVDTFVMAKGFFWCARDELHEWSLGVEKDGHVYKQERLLGLESEKQQIAGLFKASLKHTDSKTQKTYRNWFFMMPRKADGTLALDKPRFAPKDQVKLVNELDKHWDDLRDYSYEHPKMQRHLTKHVGNHGGAGRIRCSLQRHRRATCQAAGGGNRHQPH